jgi:hypothetical protein
MSEADPREESVPLATGHEDPGIFVYCLHSNKGLCNMK